MTEPVPNVHTLTSEPAQGAASGWWVGCDGLSMIGAPDSKFLSSKHDQKFWSVTELRACYLAAIHGGDSHARPDISVQQQPEVAAIAHDEAGAAARAHIHLHLAAAALTPLPLSLIILKQRPITCSSISGKDINAAFLLNSRRKLPLWRMIRRARRRARVHLHLAAALRAIAAWPHHTQKASHRLQWQILST